MICLWNSDITSALDKCLIAFIARSLSSHLSNKTRESAAKNVFASPSGPASAVVQSQSTPSRFRQLLVARIINPVFPASKSIRASSLEVADSSIKLCVNRRSYRNCIASRPSSVSILTLPSSSSSSPPALQKNGRKFSSTFPQAPPRAISKGFTSGLVFWIA